MPIAPMWSDYIESGGLWFARQYQSFPWNDGEPGPKNVDVSVADITSPPDWRVCARNAGCVPASASGRRDHPRTFDRPWGCLQLHPADTDSELRTSPVGPAPEGWQDQRPHAWRLPRSLRGSLHAAQGHANLEIPLYNGSQAHLSASFVQLDRFADAIDRSQRSLTERVLDPDAEADSRLAWFHEVAGGPHVTEICQKLLAAPHDEPHALLYEAAMHLGDMEVLGALLGSEPLAVGRIDPIAGLRARQRGASATPSLSAAIEATIDAIQQRSGGSAGAVSIAITNTGGVSIVEDG